MNPSDRSGRQRNPVHMKLENHVDFFLIHCGVRLHIKIVDDLPALVIGHLAALGHRDEFFPERGIEGLFRGHRDGKSICLIAGDIEIQQVGDAFFLFPQTFKRGGMPESASSPASIDSLFPADRCPDRRRSFPKKKGSCLLRNCPFWTREKVIDEPDSVF